LITRIPNQGAYTHGLQRVLTKMLNRHWKPFEKFNVSLEQIALDILLQRNINPFCTYKDTHFDCWFLKSKHSKLTSRHSTPTARDIKRWQFLCTLFSESEQ